jgi:hypothetical protein
VPQRRGRGGRRALVAPPPTPHRSTRPTAYGSPGWASQRPPVWGMRAASPRRYNLVVVEPGASITPLLRPPGFPIGFAPPLPCLPAAQSGRDVPTSPGGPYHPPPWTAGLFVPKPRGADDPDCALTGAGPRETMRVRGGPADLGGGAGPFWRTAPPQHPKPPVLGIPYGAGGGIIHPRGAPPSPLARLTAAPRRAAP